MRLTWLRLAAVSLTIAALWTSPTAAQFSFSRTFVRNVPVDTSFATPQTIALADLTGDMRDDIVVVDNEADQIAVYLNNGTGGFPGSPTSTFGTGFGPVAVVTADFNTDGFLDVATANDVEGEITVQLGDGTGNFNSPRDFPVDPGPVALVAVDLNNNLIPDLAVLSATTVHLLQSNDDGTFSNFIPASIRTFCNDGVAIAAGLFDDNTNQDLAIACNADGQVSVLLGNGNGTFNSAMLNNAGDGPGALVVSELIQSNLRDIAVVQADSLGDENVSLLLGNGDGTFDFSTTTAGVDSTAITSADFNLDGLRDLAVTNTGESFQIAVLQNTPNEGDNGFTFLSTVPGTSLGFDALAFAIQAGSLNGDGFPDLIALAEDEEGAPLIGVLINTSNQTPGPTTPPTVGTVTATPGSPSPTPTVTATPTISSTPSVTNTFTPTLTPTPIPTVPYGPPCNVPIGGNPVGVAVGRLVDERPFVAIANNSLNRIDIRIANINTPASEPCDLLGLETPTPILDVTGPVALISQTVDPNGNNVPLDVDRNGKTDLAVVGEGGLYLLTGDGAGGFTRLAPLPAGTHPSSLSSADYNRDGLPDVIVADNASSDLLLFLGNDHGTFDVPCPVNASRTSNVVVSQDLNRDGRADFAIASEETVQLSPFLQKNPTFTATPRVTVTPTQIAIIGLPTSTPTRRCDLSTAFTGIGSENLPLPPRSMVVDIFEFMDRVPDIAVALSRPSPTPGTGGRVNVFFGRSIGTMIAYQLNASLVVPGPTPLPGETPKPSQLSAIGSGDVNDDGLNDLILADSRNSTLVIFLAGSNGGFTTSLIPLRIDSTPKPTPANPVALAVAKNPDIDGDGKPDLVIANAGNGSVSFFLSRIQPATPTPTTTNSPTATATQTASGTPTPTPTITLSPTITASPTPTSTPTQTRVPSPLPTQTPKPGAFNLSSCAIGEPLEPRSDRAWPLLCVALTFAVLRSRRRRLRGAEASHLLQPRLGRARLTSFQRWLWLPLVAIAVIPTSARRSPAQTFIPFESRCEVGLAPVSPGAITTDDFNRDGAPDLAFVDTTANRVLVRLTDRMPLMFGDCLAALSQGPDLAVGTDPQDIASGDFERNDTFDLAVAVQTGIDVLRGRGDGTFDDPQHIDTPGVPKAVLITDVDGDGFPDLVIGSGGGSNELSVLYQRSNGQFLQATTIEVNGPVTGIVAQDLNKDSFVDLGATTEARELQVFLQNPLAPRTFPTSFALAVGLLPTAIELGDFTRDGNLDVAITGGGETGMLKVFQNLLPGSPPFDPTPTFTGSTASNPSSLAINTLNVNFPSYVVVANEDSALLNFFISEMQDGGWTLRHATCEVPFNTCFSGGGAQGVVLADLDGDGLSDVIVTNQTGQSLTLVLTKQPMPLPSPTPGSTNTSSPTLSATVTPSPTPGDCCSSHAGTSCNNPACASCVCGVDPPCCADQWDDMCVNDAATVCAVACGCGIPSVTPTSTPSGTATATATSTLAPENCCQCSAQNSCGLPSGEPPGCANGCVLIIDASCMSSGQCVQHTRPPTPTPASTPTATPTWTPTLAMRTPTPTPTPTATGTVGPNDCCQCNNDTCGQPVSGQCADSCPLVLDATCILGQCVTHTPTPVPTPTATRALLPTASPTAAATPTATPSMTRTGTITPTPSPQCLAGGVCIQGESCDVGRAATQPMGAQWLILPAAAWLLRRRQRR